MIITEDKIRKEFEDAKAFMYGHFVLASGKHSDTYIQCAKLMYDTKRSAKVLGWLAEKIRMLKGNEVLNKVNTIISPAIGGIIAGYEIARNFKNNFVFFERVHKKFQLRRGFEIESGSKVIIVEDVLTTGGSCLEIIEYLDKYSVEVVLVASLIDRSNGLAHKNLNKDIVSLLTLNLETYNEDDLPDDLKLIPKKILGTKAVSVSETKIDDIL